MLPLVATRVEEKLYSLATECAFLRFSIEDIQLATWNFDVDLIIGKGGFGNVYKGHIFTRDTTPCFVAIKRLDTFSNQGAAEFMTEIEMLTKARHHNLVSLIGYCSEINEKILVYEYMPIGTVEHHLHKAGTPLSWMDRLKISIGAARGLQYLHSGVHTKQEIIHGDVKSSNILLDENWAAKISDFGMSKVISQQSSGVITKVKGTFGYLDPEYCNTGKLTKESDVYSFGVVLFELLSGRCALDTLFVEDGINLAGWAKRSIKERRLDQVFVRIADRCLKSSRKERPTMTDVSTLQLSTALQEQYASSAQGASSMGFTHRMQHLLFGSRLNSETKSVLEEVPTSPLRVPPSPHRFAMSPKLHRIGSVHLTLRQVARATTQNFSPSLKLGESCGTVYKAQLPDGRFGAIKRVRREHFDATGIEYRNEVELLHKVDHMNILKFLGYVDGGSEHLIITEYVTNGTLIGHLDGIHGNFLEFGHRLGICIDIAHGLTYLHLYTVKQIIHRDVKSSNILLTERLRAKVANFGVADIDKSYVGGAEIDKTYVVTEVIKGADGYLDPEYMRTFQLIPKSDVYSFGVLLIEILTGRRPIKSGRSYEEYETLRWAFGKYIKGDIMDLVDPQMKEALDIDIVRKIFELAFQCAAPTRADRPDMKVVAEQLWAIRVEYLKNENA
ncbi:uncharacterized protein LOC143555005 [Bidens hawaiensis]|uniref:uncharacterized protein LOC143555005 n=1 Tax=Bidens hawaiensis TaxID=980011 RepID=UPI004049E484